MCTRHFLPFSKCLQFLLGKDLHRRQGMIVSLEGLPSGRRRRFLLCFTRSNVDTQSIGSIDPPVSIGRGVVNVGIVAGVPPRSSPVQSLPRVLSWPSVLVAYPDKSGRYVIRRSLLVVHVHRGDARLRDSDSLWRRCRRGKSHGADESESAAGRRCCQGRNQQGEPSSLHAGNLRSFLGDASAAGSADAAAAVAIASRDTLLGRKAGMEGSCFDEVM